MAKRPNLVERVADKWKDGKWYRPNPRPSYDGGMVVSLWTNGDRIYSYNTCIAERLPHGRILVNLTKYSVTTTKQVSKLRTCLRQYGLLDCHETNTNPDIIYVWGIPYGADTLAIPELPR